MLLYASGYVGKVFPDPIKKNRIWKVNYELCPTKDTQSIRLRAFDDRGVVTFLSTRDFDLLRGQVKPGALHEPTMKSYPEIGDYNAGWEGLRVDEEDLEDDLYLRELTYRWADNGWYWYNPLPPLDIPRYVHTDGRDFLLLEKMVEDVAPETRLGPDSRFTTMCRRWSQYHKEQIDWEQLPQVGYPN
jgi:hypothetical protein